MEKSLVTFDYDGTTYIGTGLIDGDKDIDKKRLELKDYLVWQTSDLVSRARGFSEGEPGLANYDKIVKSTYKQAEKDNRLIESIVIIPVSKGIIHYLDWLT